MVKLDDPDLPVPFCKDAALPLAGGFLDALGSLANDFLATVEDGKVSLSKLDRLALIKPSRIQAGSPEQRHLGSVLMARHETATSSDHARYQTLLLLLQLSRQLRRPPKSEETKWVWFGASAAREIGLCASDLRPVWALYQTSDLFRLGYETLLYAGLRILNDAPRSRLPLPGVVAELMNLADLPSNVRLEDWMLEQADGDSFEDRARTATLAMQEAHSSGDSQQEVRSALTLIATLTLKARQFDRSVLQWLGTAGHFQSLVSEAEFLKAWQDLSAAEAISGLLRDRI
ncbi:MAG: hypothetical protein J0G94_08745, partial [Sphingomonadales bacterium]|nr:hypothetical protein [Sphingomonadales bacterium]